MKSEMQDRQRRLEEMCRLALNRGGQCLSKQFVNNKTKLRWRCEQGHEWEAVPGSILGSGSRKGSWCPICAGKLSKQEHLKLLSEVAKARGGQLLSKRYVAAKSPLHWRCSQGHTWKAAPDTVKHGTWCPTCVIIRREDRLPGRSLAFNLISPKGREAALERLRSFARAFGGACLASQYTNIETPVRWRCAEAHEWDARPYTVQKGHWCPVCSAGVSERICRALLEHITGERFPKHRPVWLKINGGRGMELDGYSERLGLAFEYQGVQHYKFIQHFHGTESNFSQRQKMDETKRQLCKKNNVLLLEIPGNIRHEKLQTYLTKEILEVTGRPELIQNHQTVKIADLQVWSLKRIEEMKHLALSRGGSCLSDFYVDNNTKLRWCCSEGHEWESVPGSIKMGTWCPKCGDARAAKKRSRSISDMHQYAASRGGECLSLEYKNARSRLRWRCAKGHEWLAQANHVVAGHWCPKCGKEKLARLFALSIEDMKTAAKKRGGLCLSENYENQRTRLRWRCARGHEWDAVAMSIRHGSWCPVCAGRRPKLLPTK